MKYMVPKRIRPFFSYMEDQAGEYNEDPSPSTQNTSALLPSISGAAGNRLPSDPSYTIPPGIWLAILRHSENTWEFPHGLSQEDPGAQLSGSSMQKPTPRLSKVFSYVQSV